MQLIPHNEMMSRAPVLRSEDSWVSPRADTHSDPGGPNPTVTKSLADFLLVLAASLRRVSVLNFKHVKEALGAVILGQIQ